jgi:hypothetical protein
MFNCITGIYNTNGLFLKWVDDSPVSITPNTHMSGYYISNMWTNTSKESVFHTTNFYKYGYPSKQNSYLLSRNNGLHSQVFGNQI